jgi:hypothetical protein
VFGEPGCSIEQRAEAGETQARRGVEEGHSLRYAPTSDADARRESPAAGRREFELAGSPNT